MCFPVYLFYVKVNIGVNECANTVDKTNGGMTALTGAMKHWLGGRAARGSKSRDK